MNTAQATAQGPEHGTWAALSPTLPLARSPGVRENVYNRVWEGLGNPTDHGFTCGRPLSWSVYQGEVGTECEFLVQVCDTFPRDPEALVPLPRGHVFSIIPAVFVFLGRCHSPVAQVVVRIAKPAPPEQAGLKGLQRTEMSRPNALTFLQLLSSQHHPLLIFTCWDSL